MDFKRLVAFFAISLAIFAGWEHFFPSPKPNPAQQAAQQQQQQTAATAAAEAALAPATPITVTTDTVKAVIDEKSGDLRQMTLLKYKANGDENKPFTLFNDSKEYTYVAQSELLDAQGNNILKGVNFTAARWSRLQKKSAGSFPACRSAKTIQPQRRQSRSPPERAGNKRTENRQSLYLYQRQLPRQRPFRHHQHQRQARQPERGLPHRTRPQRTGRPRLLYPLFRRPGGLHP